MIRRGRIRAADSAGDSTCQQIPSFRLTGMDHLFPARPATG